ncbi:MAG TPA: D-alanyl-D-alanine carboxypeptidase family protein [Candidatus Binataceae bacterium]|nr:D-alanyl-D-alanine carboxypeptidase family protein [Candidatus Binataceae bacterium]
MCSSPVSPIVSLRAGKTARPAPALAALLVITTALTAALTMIAPTAALARRRRSHPAAAASSASPVKLTEPYAAALSMEPESGTVIFENNAHKPWPTASLAKMMIAMIVARKLADGSLKLSDRITTSRKAAEMGGSQVYLKEGETFSLDDMMKAIMVHSANDASVAVAEYIGGSTEAFVLMMNREAARLGMKDTHYYSVHGLPPGPGQLPDISSAWDEALLARALIAYPQVMRWASIDTAPFRGGAFTLRNTNHLVRTFPGCDGLKTGFYYAAGFNVVATAHRNGMRLIAVVLGSPRKGENFNSAAELLAQGFANYRMRVVGKQGAPIDRTLTVSGGSLASFKPVWGRNLSVLQKRSDEDALKVEFQLPASLAAPIRAGEQVGVGQASAGGKVLVSAPLVAPAAIGRRPSLMQRLRGAL